MVDRSRGFSNYGKLVRVVFSVPSSSGKRLGQEIQSPSCSNCGVRLHTRDHNKMPPPEVPNNRLVLEDVHRGIETVLDFTCSK